VNDAHRRRANHKQNAKAVFRNWKNRAKISESEYEYAKQVIDRLYADGMTDKEGLVKAVKENIEVKLPF